MPEGIFQSISNIKYLILRWRDKEVHVYPEGINSKVDVDLELSYCDVAAQHIIHNTTGLSSKAKASRSLHVHINTVFFS